MKKISLILALAGFFHKDSTAQKFEWAGRAGDVVSDIGEYITYDKETNIYTIGNYFGSFDADPGTGTHYITLSKRSPVVSKLNASGNLIWAAAFDGSYYSTSNCIAVDDTGNVYCTGVFESTTDFDPGSGTYFLTPPSGQRSRFLVKLDKSGALVWAKKFDVNEVTYETCRTLTIDNAGNIIATGNFRGVTDFGIGGPPTLLTTVSASEDIFVCKFKPNGDLIWAKQLSGTQSKWVQSIKTDLAGNIYLSGAFAGTLDFGSSTSLASVDELDGFLCKLNSSGSTIWARGIHGNNIQSVTSVSSDQWGNIYLSGNFDDTTDMDPGPGIYKVWPAGIRNTYFSKLDASGNFAWAKLLNIPRNGSALVANDTTGSLYVTGSFSDSIDVDPGAGKMMLYPGRTSSVFLSKYDTSGSLKWAVQTLGNVSEYVQSIAVNEIGDIYLTGDFSGACDFDPGPSSFSQTAAGVQDAFFLKLNLCIVSLDRSVTYAGDSLTAGEPSAITYQWIDCSTRTSITGANKRVFYPTKAGSYAVVINRDNCTDTSICIPYAPVGVAGVNQEFFSFYPNPTGGTVTIRMNNVQEQLDIQVYNLTGQLIMRKSCSSVQTTDIFIDGAAGMYLMEVRSGDGRRHYLKIRKE